MASVSRHFWQWGLFGIELFTYWLLTTFHFNAQRQMMAPVSVCFSLGALEDARKEMLGGSHQRLKACVQLKKSSLVILSPPLGKEGLPFTSHSSR